MDYTVIGDDVNLGARLESLTRQNNNHIIISEYIYNRVKHITAVNELGSVTIKGKRLPVVIFSFPNSMKIVAGLSGHFPPDQLHQDLTKARVDSDMPLYIYHIKPIHEKTVIRELKALGRKNV